MNAKIYNRQGIAPRTRNWQQIEVVGAHPARLGDTRVVQVIDEAALRLINSDFQTIAASPDFDGLLVDADHLSHDLSQRTEAFAWLMNTDIRDGQLWGELEWTDLGAAAVHGGRYKYFSTEYDAGDLEDLGSGRVRPARLAGLALTNRPNNKGGRPITNRKGDDSPEQNPTQLAKAKPMNTIAEKLGLPAEATEDEIVAAIGTIQNRAARADDLENEAAAETILNRHEKRIPEGQRDAWKAELIKNREGAERLIVTLPERTEEKPEEKGRPAITNRESAKVPGAERAHGEGDMAAKQQAAVLTIQNRDKCSYVRAFNIAKLENPNLFQG